MRMEARLDSIHKFAELMLYLYDIYFRPKFNLLLNCISFPAFVIMLTHISIASFLWDIGKQCKTGPDAAKGVV